MALVITETIKYEPAWNPTTEKYEDVCPFEKHKTGNVNECNCRFKNDRFSTTTGYDQHVRLKSHIGWVKNFGLEVATEVTGLRSELIQLRRDNAILHTNLEKQKARGDKYKRKYELLNERVP
jgi:hypothetical protein